MKDELPFTKLFLEMYLLLEKVEGRRIDWKLGDLLFHIQPKLERLSRELGQHDAALDAATVLSCFLQRLRNLIDERAAARTVPGREKLTQRSFQIDMLIRKHAIDLVQKRTTYLKQPRRVAREIMAKVNDELEPPIKVDAIYKRVRRLLATLEEQMWLPFG